MGIVSGKDEAAYQQCVADIDNDAPAALEDAKRWVKQSGSMAAYHCKAMAEFRVKRHNQAASTLNQLHSLLPTHKKRLRRNIRLQAIKASRLGKDYRQAEERASQFIRHLQGQIRTTADRRDMTNALLERSKIRLALGNPLKSLHDLDHILSLNSEHQTARLQRARVYFQIGKVSLSRQEIEAVLRQNPGNLRAQRLMARLVEGS